MSANPSSPEPLSPSRLNDGDELRLETDQELIRSLWAQGRALAAVGLQARLKAADLSLVPAAAGAALRRDETLAAAIPFKADPDHWAADPLAPMEAFRDALQTTLNNALGQACQVSARALLDDQRQTALIACAVTIPEPLDMSQWGLAQSRLRSLLRLAGVEDPMSRAHNAIHCELADRWDDWIEEIAVEASPSPSSASRFSTINR